MKPVNAWSLGLLLCLFHIQAFAINPLLLKDTHDVLPDNNYAPVWGLIFIECRIAEQWFKFSPKQMTKAIEEELKNVPANQASKKGMVLEFLKQQENNETGTQNLVGRLFNIAGGTFQVTQAADNPVHHLTPYHIGQILRIVKDSNANYDLANKNLKTFLGALAKQLSLETGAFNKFANALTQALKDCTGPDRIYPENTAQGFMLGYLLAISNSRQDLENYFNGFLATPETDQARQSAKTPPPEKRSSPKNSSPVGQAVPVALHASVATVQKLISLPVASYSLKDMHAILDKKDIDMQKFSNFADFVCAKIYTSNYDSDLPKISSSAPIYVKYCDIGFPDCMETTLLNLSNIATYNQTDEQQRKIGIMPSGLTVNRSLQDFYSNPLCCDNAEVNNQVVHQAWVHCVENVIGVVYKKITTAQSKNSNTYYDVGCSGFIPVVFTEKIQNLTTRTFTFDGTLYSAKELALGSQKYLLIDQNSEILCFEVRSNLSNIIVLLNHLFRLSLYESIDEVLKSDFSAQYFSRLCQKFNWTVNDESLELIARSSHGSFLIQLKTITGSAFVINIDTNVHGYIITNPTSTVGANISKDQIMTCQEPMQAAFIALQLIDYRFFMKNNPKNSFFVYFKPILDPNSRLRFINMCFKDKNFTNFAWYLAQLILSMATYQDRAYQGFDDTLSTTTSDPVILQSVKLMTDIYYLIHKTHHFYCSSLLLNNQSFPIDQKNAALDSLLLSVKDDYHAVHTKAWKALDAAILNKTFDPKRTDQAFDAILAATKITNYPMYISMVTSLIAKNALTVQQTIRAIAVLIENKDQKIVASALQDLNLLITSNQELSATEIHQAIDLLFACTKNQNPETASYAQNLMHALTKNQNPEIAFYALQLHQVHSAKT